MTQSKSIRDTPSLPRRTAHLFGLSALVIAKPLFDIMANAPEYFIVNRITNAGVYVFILTLAIITPLMLTILSAAASRISARLGNLVQSTILFILIAIFLIQIVRRIDFIPAFLCVTFAIVLAGLASISYTRSNQFSTQFSNALLLLTPIALIFPAMFFFNSDIQRVLYPQNPVTLTETESSAVWLDNSPPVVMLIFDEFPLVDLLDAEGAIDERRFPNFAAFASTSTWYANATTVHDATTEAVPAILTGKRHQPGQFARAVDHPLNLFSMLRNHYAFNVVEPVTQLNLAPDSADTTIAPTQSRMTRARIFAEDLAVLYLQFTLPNDFRNALPNTTNRWGHFLAEDIAEKEHNSRSTQNPHLAEYFKEHPEEFKESLRKKKQDALESNRTEIVRHVQQVGSAVADATTDRKRIFEDFISSLQHTPKSTLHFMHVMLPHVPYWYLPSGKWSSEGEIEGIDYEATDNGNVYVGVKPALLREHQNHMLQVGFTDTLFGSLIEEMRRVEIFNDALIVIVADHGKSFQLGVPERNITEANFGGVAFVPLFIKYPNQRKGIRDDSNVETIDILPTIRDALGAKVNWSFDGRSLLDPHAAPRTTKQVTNKFKEGVEFNQQQFSAARTNAHARNVQTFSLQDSRATLFHFGEGLDWIGTQTNKIPPDAIRATIETPNSRSLGTVDLDLEFLRTHLSGTVQLGQMNMEDAMLMVSVNGTIQQAARPFEFGGQIHFDVILSDTIFKQGSNDVRILLVDRTKV